MKTKLALALFIALGACKKEESQTILCGILPDLKNESITLIPIDGYFPGKISTGKFHTVKTDSIGRFRFSFPAASSNFYQIVKNNYHQLKADIFAEPGVPYLLCNHHGLTSLNFQPMEKAAKDSII